MLQLDVECMIDVSTDALNQNQSVSYIQIDGNALNLWDSEKNQQEKLVKRAKQECLTPDIFSYDRQRETRQNTIDRCDA